MPCYTINEVSVNLGKLDTPTLVAGLKAAGYHGVQERDGVITAWTRQDGGVSLRIDRKGEVTFTSRGTIDKGQETNAIKRAYSTQVVQSQARRFGWKTVTTGPNKLTVRR